MLWLLNGMFIRVKKLWNHSTKFVSRQSYWRGWILTYIGKKVFDYFNTRLSKGDLFHLKFMASINILMNKVLRMKTQKLFDIVTITNSIFAYFFFEKLTSLQKFIISWCLSIYTIDTCYQRNQL